MNKKCTIVLLLLICSSTMMAQDSLKVISEDSLVVEEQDTVLLKSYSARYDPRKALLYAAVLPGMGQVYNKKYWKLPLVYGGFFALGYAINFYQDLYKDYKTQLFRNLNSGYDEDNDVYPDPNDPNKYTTGTLRTAVDKARRERDFFVILMGAMYLLQIVDAHVDAHLKEFDLNPTLKVSIRPSINQNELLGQQNSIALVIRF
jgi:hypothetical protein